MSSNLIARSKFNVQGMQWPQGLLISLEILPDAPLKLDFTDGLWTLPATR